MTALFLFIVGVIVSEFIQLLVDRDNSPTSFFDRSRCDNCHKTLPWYGLIPLVGFLLVRGKCIHCNKKISIKYPIFESAFALSWAVTLIYVEQTIPALVFLSLLLIVFYLAYFDLRQHQVPLLALGALALNMIAYHFYVYALRLDILSAIFMLGIIIVSIFFVRFQKRDISFSDAFGPADWIILLISAFTFGIEPTVFMIVVSVLLLLGYLFINIFLKKKTIEGVPFVFWFLPIFYAFALYFAVFR